MSNFSEHDDLGILLAMVFIAWSDKSLADDELQLIRAEAHDQGLDEQELSLLLQAIYQPPSPEIIATYLPTPQSRKAAAVAAYVAALSDHSLTFAELDAFDRLCEALDLSEAEREEIRDFGDRELRLARAGNWRDALLLERAGADIKRGR